MIIINLNINTIFDQIFDRRIQYVRTTNLHYGTSTYILCDPIHIRFKLRAFIFMLKTILQTLFLVKLPVQVLLQYGLKCKKRWNLRWKCVFLNLKKLMSYPVHAAAASWKTIWRRRRRFYNRRTSKPLPGVCNSTSYRLFCIFMTSFNNFKPTLRFTKIQRRPIYSLLIWKISLSYKGMHYFSKKVQMRFKLW